MIAYPQMSRGWSSASGTGRALGVDLAKAVVDGWLTRQELSGLVQQCEQCATPAVCAIWRSDPAAATALPAACSNKTQIEALRF